MMNQIIKNIRVRETGDVKTIDKYKPLKILKTRQIPVSHFEREDKRGFEIYLILGNVFYANEKDFHNVKKMAAYEILRALYGEIDYMLLQAVRALLEGDSDDAIDIINKVKSLMFDQGDDDMEKKDERMEKSNRTANRP